MVYIDEIAQWKIHLSKKHELLFPFKFEIPSKYLFN